MIEFAYSLKSDAKKAFDEIRSKSGNLYFKPNLAVVYLTENLQKDAKVFKFDFNTLCIPVEGFITPQRVWTRGCLCMFMDIDYSLNVLKGSINEVVEQLRNAEKGEFNLLVYPLFYVESYRSSIGKYLKLKLTSDIETASQIYGEMIYPMNTMLRPFRDESKEAVSLNIFSLKLGFGKPQIFLNGEKLGRGVVHISFSKRFDASFTDYLPERGRDLEETKEILKGEFHFVEEVELKKSSLAIGELNGQTVRDYLRKYRVKTRDNLEKDIERGDFFGATPYILLLLSRETCGSAALGLMDYNLKFYPSLFDLNVFEDRGIFSGEILKSGLERIKSEIKNLKSGFVFFDQNLMLMFEEKLVRAFKDYSGYGIITSFPSFSGSLNKRFMSEIEPNIFTNSTLSTVFVDLPDQRK